MALNASMGDYHPTHRLIELLKETTIADPSHTFTEITYFRRWHFIMRLSVLALAWLQPHC